MKCKAIPSQVPRPTCGSGSGERRVCTRGIFLPWQIVAKISIESGQLRTELACSTRDLALSHWPTSHKCTGCGCRAAFLSTTSLGKFRHQFGKVPPPIWESSATNLGFSLNCISQLDFFHICFIFVFIRFSVFHQFGKVLPPIWDFHSNVFLSWISFIFVFIRSGCLTI